MDNTAEIIDSSQMEILSEFPVEYENDEEITKAESTSRKIIYIGKLENDVIISSLSRNTNEIQGDLAVEKEHILFIAESINRLLNTEKPWEQPIEMKIGKDDLLIYYSSSWAHNLPAPFERINIKNKRNYELDDLRSRDWWLILPPKMGQRLADEIKKLF